MRRYGYELPDDILGEDEIHELEPSLNDRVKAGFHLAEQWNVKADTLVDGLAPNYASWASRSWRAPR